MRFLFLFLILFSVLNAYSPRNTKRLDSLEKVSLQLDWKYEFEFAGFIAAKEKGFYKDVGLDVALKEFNNGTNVIDDVISGKSTYGISNSSTLIAYLKGKPIVLVASFFKRSALVLITKPEIKSPKDLVGKRIMTSSKENFMLNFGPYLRGYGVSINDLTLVKHTFNVKAFADGSVDAMTAYISDQPYKLDALGIKYNILNPSNDNLFTLQEELFTSKNEVKNHLKRVEKFRKASIKGWKYAFEHKAELIDIIHKKYAPNISKKALAYEADSIEKLILPYIYDIGFIDTNFLYKQIRFFKNEYHIGKNKDLKDFIFKVKCNSLHLTQEEQKYIQENPKIPMCINYDFFPIGAYEDGKYIGMTADVYKIISDKTGLEFVPIPSDSEQQLQEHLEEKKCKLVSITATVTNNFKTIKTTTPLGRTYFTLLSKLDKSFVSNPKLLKNKLLIVQRESFKNYLNYLYPYLNIEVEDDKNKMLDKVMKNKAYAIVTIDEQSDYFIDKYGYGKLKINGFLAKEHELSASIGVQKDEPILFSIMQKTLNSIPRSKIQLIMDRWRLTRYHEKNDYYLLWRTLFVMSIIFLIMIYYQRKLKSFNKELEKSVDEKTKELRKINDSLEINVQEKVNELIQKDEILTKQSKQAVMGEMISMIAHQWRQPLNTISLTISNIELEEMIGEKPSREKLFKTLDNINKTIQYLSNTVDDFKTYFQPNKNSSKVALLDVVQKSVGFVDARLKKESVKVEYENIDEVTLNIYSSELIQVFLNILNNAIDAYSQNNVPTKKSIIISSKKADKNIQIFIKDYAGGIATNVMQKLFEPYFSTKDKNGTGLGLYMSKMIIEKQFHGTIDVESVDKSTTFIIDIPIDIKKV
ncbi:ABC transporter substrate-binding protein [Sulfurimonas sp.]